MSNLSDLAASGQVVIANMQYGECVSCRRPQARRRGLAGGTDRRL